MQDFKKSPVKTCCTSVRYAKPSDNTTVSDVKCKHVMWLSKIPFLFWVEQVILIYVITIENFIIC